MKHYYNKLCLTVVLALMLGLFNSNLKAQLLINEGFTTVLPTGWAQQNLSTPAGTNPVWFQGNTAVFDAFSGAATSYAACNYNSVAGANTISNWLFTPEVALANGNIISFYTRATTGGGVFPDRLELRMSTSGASVNVGATNTSVGDFSTVLVTVNPSLTTTGYPEVWTKYTVTISGLPAATTGRFAFRYFVTDGGPLGNNSNFIGVDDVQYGPPCSGAPAPGNTVSSVASVCSGVAFTLSLQNPPNSMGITYQWQSGASATGPWTSITGATNPTYSTSITTATYFQCVVSCGASSTASTPVQVTMNAPLACYCIPGATNCTLDDEILNVKFGTLDNSSSGCTGSGYTDYTTTVAPGTNVFIGAPNPMTVTIGPGGNDNVGVWIDYNVNGQYEATEFTLLGNAATGAISGTIAVPSTVAAGTYRMRVRVKFTTPVLNGSQACSAYTYGETEDYRITLVPCVAASITTQPVNRTINCGDNTTFSVVTAGSLPVVYWEYRTSATGTWQNVTAAAPFTYTGANTNTLSLTNASGSLNGYQFRAVYSGACAGVDFSTAATLTVNPLIATISPVNPTVCTGSTTAINITNTSVSTTSAYISSGTLNTVIPDNNVYGNGDNVGINNTINVTTLPTGAIITGLSVRLNIVHSWVGDLIIVLKSPNGKIYNLDYALTATGGTGATTGFTNTIISSGLNLSALSSGANPWTGTFRPDNQDPAAGDPDVPLGPAGFIPDTRTITDLYAGAGNGGWTLALYDYYDDLTVTNRLVDWAISFTYGAPQTGVFSPTTGLYTNAAGTIAYTGTAVSTVYAAPAASTTYTLVVTNPTCTSSPLSIPVTVSAPLSTVTVPAATAACIGTPKTISSTLGSGLASVVTYAWQVSTDGGTSYTAVANGTAYSGATTANLTITSPTAAMTGYRYRVIASIATCGSSVTSTPTVLTVNARPVLTVSANPYTAIYPGQTTTLTVNSTTTAPAAGYQWYRNGVAVSGATSNTLVVDIDGLGEYTVDVVDANGCGNAVTPSITISEAQNDILFIYPSPNSGQFQVRYYSQAGNTALPRVLNVYDSKGARVYSKQYSITVPYTRMDVDMSNFSAGIYLVELIDRTGARIKTGRVLIQK
ncbi:MAG: choice-of-anchor J domain-containing protein [Ferruginibacter sp.]